MAKRHHEAITTKGIYVEDERHLPLDEAHVEALAASIKEIGLIEPIIVCRRYHRAPTVVLVAGRHRLEAHKRLKLKTILAIVEEEDSPEVERWRKLAEIDENLIRRTLTAAQRASLIARRKAVYEEVHPETKHGGARRGLSCQLGHLKPDRFTAVTAAKTGKPERTIRRDAARGKALGPDLDRIAGTSLDKGSELDALATIPPQQRAPIIDRAVAGEEVSAVALLAPPPPDEPRQGYSELVRTWRRFRYAMERASPAGLRAFLDECHQEIEALRSVLEKAA
jgi:ParB family transcriptional regulator, chromosome partitioning protein